MMKRYLYNYQTVVRFGGDVGAHQVKLRCQPCTNNCQNVVREGLMLHPSDFIMHNGADVFGNRLLFGGTLLPHSSLVYISSGVVELDWYHILEDKADAIYLYSTEKTTVSEDMLSNLSVCLPVVPYDRAMELCHYVHRNMEYVPDSTDMKTTAAQAFSGHKGVCQDFTHVFIAMCRHYGIPARYVNGFICGEGETHAWAEIYDGEMWLGVDPTHDCQIFCGYIKVAHGRDADDCPVSRGCYVGNKSQQTIINVLVNEI